MKFVLAILPDSRLGDCSIRIALRSETREDVPEEVIQDLYREILRRRTNVRRFAGLKRVDVTTDGVVLVFKSVKAKDIAMRGDKTWKLESFFTNLLNAIDIRNRQLVPAAA